MRYLLLFAMFVAGCSPLKPIKGEPLEVRLEYEPNDSSRPAALVYGDAGSVHIAGTVTTASSAYALSAKANRNGSTIEVRVEASPVGIGMTVVTPFAYSATIRHVPAGTYRVEVVEIADGRSERRVLHGIVVR